MYRPHDTPFDHARHAQTLRQLVNHSTRRSRPRISASQEQPQPALPFAEKLASRHLLTRCSRRPGASCPSPPAADARCCRFLSLAQLARSSDAWDRPGRRTHAHGSDSTRTHMGASPSSVRSLAQRALLHHAARAHGNVAHRPQLKPPSRWGSFPVEHARVVTDRLPCTCGSRCSWSYSISTRPASSL